MQGEGASGVQALVEARGLAQISDPAALEAIVDGVLAVNPKQLAMFRGGKTKLQGFFVGCAALHASAQLSTRRSDCCACLSRQPRCIDPCVSFGCSELVV